VTPPELPVTDDNRPAGVLCLLFEDSGETFVVLTRRSAHLSSHGGEVSFPGGRLQAGETPVQAALREAEEEIGVAGAEVEVIGELSQLTTRRSPAIVHCFVGIFPGPGAEGATFLVDAGEVERLFCVPLARLVADGVFHEELWPGPAVKTGEASALHAVPFFAVDGETVWGATGRFLFELLNAVMSRRSTGGFPEGSLVER
jgi:8-oxo-dGTP pyrophosphatase MutT (NUDIX family)